MYKFQGFGAGFDDLDQVNQIMAHISDLDWEKINPCTAYVVTSQAKIIGNPTDDNPYATDSELYFGAQ